ncbi:MAG: RraA family protein [Planctomycetota bacterium]|jgi:regulator of RNase E activity RraA
MKTRKTKVAMMAGLTALAGLLWISVFAMAKDSKPAESVQNIKPDLKELRAGKNFLPTKVYSIEDDRAILKLFKGLRVADVSDGMDKAGLYNIGLMSPQIHAAWKDTEHFAHCFAGIALTVRFVPTNKPPAARMEAEEFIRWSQKWHQTISTVPFRELIREGTALVFDDAPNADVGTIGSKNIMAWRLRGCTGVVTDATARDIDEVAVEKIPLYFRQPGRGLKTCRNEIESVNRPIVCGGVLVEPGDVIVASGDGVIVVPRSKAKEVGEYARATLERDKVGRRRLYEKLRLKPDDSVK